MLGCGNQNMVQNSAWFLGKREEREEEITVEDCSIKWSHIDWIWFSHRLGTKKKKLKKRKGKKEIRKKER